MVDGKDGSSFDTLRDLDPAGWVVLDPCSFDTIRADRESQVCTPVAPYIIKGS